MPVIAVIFEILLLICIIWSTAFLSTFLHELGHALGYMLSTGGKRWHIRVGSGKKLLETKLLTVKFLITDGVFEPVESRIDSRAKLIITLAGGPAVSLILVTGLLFLRFGEVSFGSGIISSGAADFLINFALIYNVTIFILSVIPAHYFFGEIRGMETDGLKIFNAIKGRDQK